MELTLTLVRYQSRPATEASTVRIGTDGGTIGRSTDNDLVLADPERWVGRHHARISFRNGAFFLTDTSKNGTFVNSAAQPLREGQEVELHEGDELGIGAYEIRVALEAAQPQPAASFDPFAAGQAELEPLGMTPSGPATPDILDLVGGAPPAGPEPFLPREPKSKGPVDLDAWLMPDSQEAEAWSLGSERAAPEPPALPTEADHVPDEDAFFAPPQAIPEDYDIWADQSGPRRGGEDTAAVEQQRPDTPPAPSTPNPEAQQPPAITPAKVSREKTPRPASGPKSVPESLPGSVRAETILESFIAGLEAGELPPDPQAQARLMRSAGVLLRAMTEGLMRVMMGRAKFKSELRLEVTAIRSTKNNPFKFSVDPEDALAHLLFRPSRGFMPPIGAAQEAFDDILCHEMAIIAGLRGALRALLARMDPAELERRFRDPSVIDNLMPMARKAKYWDLFTATYKEISAEAADDFLTLFKDAFTRAYEEQASRLRQAKPSDQAPSVEP